MSNTSESESNLSLCANCGKGEEDASILKRCGACLSVKYCNRECQSAHRPQHKKECKKKAKELHDEKLFEEPPPLDDCPICMIRLPTFMSARGYFACCGKLICSGCIYAPVYDNQGNVVAEKSCPFCRTPSLASDEEHLKRMKNRAKVGDAMAIYIIGNYYNEGGHHNFPQDYVKALELFHQAGELGHAAANYNIGCAYTVGRGAAVDQKKAKRHYELSAMIGDSTARHNLGARELLSGNKDRALKHFMIAVRGGNAEAVKRVQECYMDGFATKDDYAKALRSYQAYVDEIKSDQREEAATIHGKRYY